MSAFLKVQNLSKKFDNHQAVDNISFEIEEKKLFVLLGPSGCGKTTTLRCIGGLEKPDYLHPDLEEILTETFGVMIYQEQVMQIAQVLSGFSLGNADLLRRAM